MQKLESLSFLRGIFIMMIVFHHLGLYDGGGSLAVSFFFILGGFALSLGYYEKISAGSFSYGSYLYKRASKFYPLHWLCILLLLPFIIIPIIKGAISLLTTFETLLPNALLIQSAIPFKEYYFSYNAVSWYLSNTLIFASVYPLIVKLLESLSAKGKMLFLICILTCYAILVCQLPIDYRHAILYISPFVRIIDFIFGIYLYLAFSKLKDDFKFRLSNRLYIVIAAILICISILISCLVSESTCLISAIYWIPLTILLLLSSIYSYNRIGTSTNRGGGIMLIIR